ncbi:CAP family protein [Nocardiopsis sp. CNT312]|uniref:CAP family protein n=1 Tax=Nocardiopsis sp. CNT312 TaxID=1137268 RepID=UPI0004B5D9D9|nr:CAP family protein [Nocardiopsis sp. CNT312]
MVKISRSSFAALALCALLAATTQPAHAETDVPDPTGAVLDLVNDYRERHSAPPLAADAGLAEGAQEWAESLARQGEFRHSPSEVRGGAGENLFMNGGLPCDERDLSQAVDAWYRQVVDYDFHSHSFSPHVGSFTQLVWKSSERVGVGIAATPEGHRCMVVARFDPPGNVMGRFEENVLPLQRG